MPTKRNHSCAVIFMRHGASASNWVLSMARSYRRLSYEKRRRGRLRAMLRPVAQERARASARSGFVCVAVRVCVAGQCHKISSFLGNHLQHLDGLQSTTNTRINVHVFKFACSPIYNLTPLHMYMKAETHVLRNRCTHISCCVHACTQQLMNLLPATTQPRCLCTALLRCPTCFLNWDVQERDGSVRALVSVQWTAQVALNCGGHHGCDVALQILALPAHELLSWRTWIAISRIETPVPMAQDARRGVARSCAPFPSELQPPPDCRRRCGKE